MEFICVLSVGGSLASYIVTKQGQGVYKATLKTGNEKQRSDIPPVIEMEKTENGWQAAPWHSEIVTGLAHAIETAA
jgi:hypothetical protein